MSGTDGITLAHGIGGAKDLPIPPELAIAGAVAALVISFTVLAVAWRTPRYDAATSGRPAPAWLAPPGRLRRVAVALRTLGLPALPLHRDGRGLRPRRASTTRCFGIFYVWWWVGLVPLSLLFGPVWKAISPVRTINLAFAKISGSDPERGVLTYPERLGYWPAALGLLAFVWMELVYPYSTEIGPIRLWCAAYVAVMLVGGALFGNTFYERADPFEVYSTPGLPDVGLGPARRPARGAHARSPTSTRPRSRPGLVAVVAVLFGSTAFDSFKDSQDWIQFIQSQETFSKYTLDNLALLAFCVGAGVIFAVGCMLTGLGRRPAPPRPARTCSPTRSSRSWSATSSPTT